MNRRITPNQIISKTLRTNQPYFVNGWSLFSNHPCRLREFKHDTHEKILRHNVS